MSSSRTSLICYMTLKLVAPGSVVAGYMDDLLVFFPKMVDIIEFAKVEARTGIISI